MLLQWLQQLLHQPLVAHSEQLRLVQQLRYKQQQLRRGSSAVSTPAGRKNARGTEEQTLVFEACVLAAPGGKTSYKAQQVCLTMKECTV